MNPHALTTTSMRDFAIEDLMTKSSFPHRVDRLELRETHVSWIVLTGPYAYKIKKPVRLDFIDASTLERRYQLCLEELRLNARLAPDLYLDVVAITRRDDGLAVGGAGPALEYAVRMRQFSPEEEMPALLATHRIDSNDMTALADTLSAFHARAAVAPWQGHSIHAQRLLDGVLANSGELIEQLQQVAPDVHLASLRHWLAERIDRDQTLFEQRERNGYVRECHGDLHLANIVRYEGRLMPFDCLEFDANLRWIDILDDIAFLIMDLVGHERGDLAFAFLSRYLESSGDYDGARLLPFYAVHRALVRAKVDALSIATIPRRAEEFRGRLNRRLRAAIDWTRPRTPALILMHGVSGSGKSWLSERLIPRIPALRVRSDVERKRMAGVSTNEPSTASVRDTIYTEQFTHRTYARLSECAEQCLTSGFNVIVDAAFLESTSRELFSGLAHRLGVPFVIVACQAPAATLRERIVTRAAHGERTSDADLAVLERQLGHASFEASERGEVIFADTSVPGTVERVARIIRERVALPNVCTD